jgi:hypothetical protein
VHAKSGADPRNRLAAELERLRVQRVNLMVTLKEHVAQRHC